YSALVSSVVPLPEVIGNTVVKTSGPVNQWLGHFSHFLPTYIYFLLMLNIFWQLCNQARLQFRSLSPSSVASSRPLLCRFLAVFFFLLSMWIFSQTSLSRNYKF
ncbi:hypothetical protein L9F63_018306, partial [Diploptera punctata]